MYEVGGNQDQGFAYLGVDGAPNSPLMQMLLSPAIEPGTSPGYELCKTISAYHPLGRILSHAPITLAQSMKREISIPVLGEKRIIERFQDVFDTIGKLGATTIINNLMGVSRIYGIGSLGVGEVGKEPNTPLDLNKLADADLFFNVLDPLNTAGSLVLNQDPNSPLFLKQGVVYVNGIPWHPSRTIAVLHEQPLYIEWTSSAYGFVGRSIYQRALFPLKTFLQTMITDQMVTQKAGLLVAKMESPGSFVDNWIQAMFGWKRAALKQGVTNQVLTIGTEEDVQTLNMQNLDKAAGFARENVLKNIASAAGMPASIVNNETLTEGFGEGTEDAKTIVRYLNYVREEMQPAYDFVDRIVMRKAWTQEFYTTIQSKYKDYQKIPFETAIHDWIRAFEATWPNLLIEPESEKVKMADVKFKTIVATIETLSPELDPENKANLISWVADNMNELGELFASKLDINPEILKTYLEEKRVQQQEASEETKEPEPKPFALSS